MSSITTNFSHLRTAAGVLACLILAGCGAASGQGTAHPSIREMTHPRIVPNPSGHPDSFYLPNPIRVHVGQAITWTNRDTDLHDVTSRDGWFSSGTLPAGGRFRWVALRPGTYPYFCTLHPDMHGVVIVTR